MIRARLCRDLRTVDGTLRLAAEFEVRPGEAVALFGRSGAGKTTLLRMLAGLLAPEEGRVEAWGEVWTDAAAGVHVPPGARGLGFMFQDYALFPNMTVAENLRFALKPGQAPGIVGELLDMVELAGLSDRRPAQLSGGQQQRAALARALVQRPRLLLLDEPLSALDWETRGRLQSELREARRRFGTAMVLVTHDPAEMRALADRALLLEGGVISRSGPPDEVLAALGLRT
ncbi:MAG: molybdate transport system ATP-binding protein [Elusimicrobia bacterium]|nr:MAG: molybdate transport system ATP-binding protein [Elusimicrobiota bacterium]